MEDFEAVRRHSRDVDEFDPLNPLTQGISVVRYMQRWMRGPQRSAMYANHYEEWIADLAKRLAEDKARLEGLVERLDAFEQDRERLLTLGNYGLEAWREAIDHRRAMLGDAAEALLLSELSAAELARVERTLRMLDPEDLELLRIVDLDDDERLGRFEVSKTRLKALQAGHLGGAALVATGCVTHMSPTGELVIGGGGAWVTPLGQLMLRFMGDPTT